MPTGAQTRFNNDLTRAAQLSMGGNKAAANSLRPQRKSVNRPAPSNNAVGNNAVGNVASPAPVASSPTIDPAGFKPISRGVKPPVMSAQEPQTETDPVVDKVIKDMQVEKLLRSSQANDAFTRVKMRDLFHGRDSGPDTGRQVLDILQTYL